MDDKISALLSKNHICTCGITHTCGVKRVVIKNGALTELPKMTSSYNNILIVADTNTIAACGYRMPDLPGVKKLIYETEDVLVPNNAAVEKLLSESKGVDLLLGVGSGVINDLCKYAAYQYKIPYIIVATAPSMDGYASAGASLLLDGLKITFPCRPPIAIVADPDILCNAPLEMIQAGFGDIIGKYSALNDWKLGHQLTGEVFCPKVYDLVMQTANQVADMAKQVPTREKACISALMEALVIVGIAMSFMNNSRPASGSEHHIAHFFELTGLERKKPYLLHGLDVGFATVLTCELRKQIQKGTPKDKYELLDKCIWKNSLKEIYGKSAEKTIEMQINGFMFQDTLSKVKIKWAEITKILSEAPSKEQIKMLLDYAGIKFDAIHHHYGDEWVNQAMSYARYTKTIYTVLWLMKDVQIN